MTLADIGLVTFYVREMFFLLWLKYFLFLASLCVMLFDINNFSNLEAKNFWEIFSFLNGLKKVYQYFIHPNCWVWISKNFIAIQILREINF